MKFFNQKTSVIGGIIALFLATSCCWLPVAVIALGGAGGWIAFSENLGQYSSLFLLVSIAFLAYGGYLFLEKKKLKTMENETILNSTITCPNCGFRAKEIMPTDACQFFYECKSCKEILKPKKGDCCVYCSFGTVACPPIQKNQDCC